jgi:hypothetical protein
LVIAVVETDDLQLGSSSATMASYVERVLMLEAPLISRCKVIDRDDTIGRVITWGENDEKVFTANEILPPVGENG